MIDLSAVDAKPAPGDQAFTFLGTAAFTGAAGELRFGIADGRTTIEFQLDKSPEIDARLILQGELTLTSADFLL